MSSMFGSLTTTVGRTEQRRTTSPQQPRVIQNWNARSAAISDEELTRNRQIQALEKSLVVLGAAFHEDYNRDLDTASRAGLERLIRKLPMASQPTIGAESSGQIIATWRDGDAALSLQFVDRLHFNYAMTTRNDEGTLGRQWGFASALTFLDEQPRAAQFFSF